MEWFKNVQLIQTIRPKNLIFFFYVSTDNHKVNN